MKKNQKKALNVKSQDVRAAEIAAMKQKLMDLGLTQEMTAVNELFQKLDEFVESGHSESLKIKLHGLQRIAVVNLCTRVQNESNLMLQYAKHV